MCIYTKRVFSILGSNIRSLLSGSSSLFFSLRINIIILVYIGMVIRLLLKIDVFVRYPRTFITIDTSMSSQVPTFIISLLRSIIIPSGFIISMPISALVERLLIIYSSRLMTAVPVRSSRYSLSLIYSLVLYFLFLIPLTVISIDIYLILVFRNIYYKKARLIRLIVQPILK